MKRILLILAVLLAACATTAPSQEKTYSVYEYPEHKKDGTIPAYRVKEMPNGEIRVYEYGDPFQYKYRVTPDGSIYKYGDPFQKAGSTTDKRGE